MSKVPLLRCETRVPSAHRIEKWHQIQDEGGSKWKIGKSSKSIKEKINDEIEGGNFSNRPEQYFAAKGFKLECPVTGDLDDEKHLATMAPHFSMKTPNKWELLRNTYGYHQTNSTTKHHSHATIGITFKPVNKPVTKAGTQGPDSQGPNSQGQHFAYAWFECSRRQQTSQKHYYPESNASLLYHHNLEQSFGHLKISFHHELRPTEAALLLGDVCIPWSQLMKEPIHIMDKFPADLMREFREPVPLNPDQEKMLEIGSLTKDVEVTQLVIRENIVRHGQELFKTEGEDTLVQHGKIIFNDDSQRNEIIFNDDSRLANKVGREIEFYHQKEWWLGKFEEQEEHGNRLCKVTPKGKDYTVKVSLEVIKFQQKFEFNFPTVEVTVTVYIKNILDSDGCNGVATKAARLAGTDVEVMRNPHSFGPLNNLMTFLCGRENHADGQVLYVAQSKDTDALPEVGKAYAVVAMEADKNKDVHIFDAQPEEKWVRDAFRVWCKFKWLSLDKDTENIAMKALEITKDCKISEKSATFLAGKFINLVSGPCIPLAFQVNMLVLFFYTFGLVFIIEVMRFLQQFDGSAEPQQFVSIPTLVFAPVFLIFAVVKIRWEIKMMAYVLPTRVCDTGIPKMFMFGRSLSPNRFLVLAVGGCVATSFDIFSTMIFLARIYLTNSLVSGTDLQQSSRVERIWHQSLEESLFIPHNFLHLQDITFQQAAKWVYFTVFLQLAYALWFSYPVSREFQSSERESAVVQYDVRRPTCRLHSGKVSKDNTIEVDERPWVTRVLFPLGETENIRERTCGFHIPSWLQPLGSHIKSVKEPPSKSCNHMMDEKKPEEKKTDEVEVVADYAEYMTCGGMQDHGLALQCLARAGRMSLAQSQNSDHMGAVNQKWSSNELLPYQTQHKAGFFVFMVQRIGSVYLQASFVSIMKCLSTHSELTTFGWLLPGIDVLTFANTILSSGMIFQSIFSELHVSYKITLEMLHRCHLETARTHVASKKRVYEFKQMTRHSVRTFLWISLGALVFAAINLHTLVKTIMASFCPCGVWNLDWPLAKGCLAASDLDGMCNSTVSF